MSLKLLSHHSTAREIKQLPGYPRLKPAYILKINIGNILKVGTVGSGQNLSLVETGTGTLTTAEGYDCPVDGEIVYGADWLLNEPDGEHAIPNLKLLIKTKDGAILSSEYTGTGVFSKPVLDMWAGDENAKTFPFGISSTYHTFQSGDPKYKHLQYKTFVGNGRFVVNDDRSITVESRISEVIPSNDLDC
ncbi:hypothetical protein QC763_0019390 [Podospora pseudopauciseta]|uniref:Uncharacterized protein n=2 Tax=Podospora TaxID=5144 RepID=A0ABR0I0S7_9PEZI|nr:hypothetical protein QC763_0019390 [Podospora pseudopauciseta]KAK4682458.1 hypothetical protein QC764_0019360 [Podospora pseudoanserina]